MSRSLSATDKTMAAYFAALMAEADEAEALAPTAAPEPAVVPVVAPEPVIAATIDELRPLPARPPREVASPPATPVLSAEEQANAAMLAQYGQGLDELRSALEPPAAAAAVVVKEAPKAATLSAEERANAEMLALYGDSATSAPALSAEERANAEMLARYGQPEPAPVTRSAAPQPKAAPVVPPPAVTAVREPQPVAKLLEQVSAVQREILPQRQQPQPVVEELANLQCILETSGLTELAGDIIPPVKADAMMAEDEFQTLYFEVAGLVLAVPLRMLGGIHRLERINKLIGKPDWYMGMMLQRDAQLHVVDTARWVMPEKYTPDLAASLNYQYLIMLDDSPWGLACERLLTAATVRKDAVRWRERNGKRPWLAGLVVERMCALIDVSALIAQLRGGER